MISILPAPPPKPRPMIAQIFGQIKVSSLYWKDQTIRLDGYHFYKCRVANCRLIFKRNSYKLERCRISDNCVIEPEDS